MPHNNGIGDTLWTAYVKKIAGSETRALVVAAAERDIEVHHKAYINSSAVGGNLNAPEVLKGTPGVKGSVVVGCEIHRFRKLEVNATDNAVATLGTFGLSPATASPLKIFSVNPRLVTSGDVRMLPDTTDNSYDLAQVAQTFGTPGAIAFTDPYHGRPKTHMNLGDEMEMHNELGSKMISELAMSDKSWHFTLFAPFREFAGQTKTLNIMKFHNHIGRRAPLETPPKLVTFSSEAKKASTRRWNIGHMLELTFMRTALGREIWTRQQLQLYYAFLSTQTVDVILQMLMAPREKTNRTEAQHQAYTKDKFDELLDDEIDQTNAVTKKDMMHELADRAKEIFEFRQVPSDTIYVILPAAAGKHLVRRPENREFLLTGKPRETYDDYRSIRIAHCQPPIWNKPLILTTWTKTDLTYKPATFGEFFFLDPKRCDRIIKDDYKGYTNADLTFQRYCHGQDQEYLRRHWYDFFENTIYWVPARHGRPAKVNHEADWPLSESGKDFFYAKKQIDGSDVKTVEQFYKAHGLPQMYMDFFNNRRRYLIEQKVDGSQERKDLERDLPRLGDDLKDNHHWRMCKKFHMPVFVSMVEFVNSITFEAAVMVFFVPGVAETLVNKPDYRVGVKVSVKTAHGHLTWHSRVWIRDADRLIIMDNVHIRRYLGGDNAKFWQYHDKDEYIRDRKKMYQPKNGSFAFLWWPDTKIPTNRIDMTGSYNEFYVKGEVERDKSGTYHQIKQFPECDIQNRFWSFKPCLDSRHLKYDYGLGRFLGKENTFLCQGLELFPSAGVKNTVEYNIITRPTGHHGKYLYPGSGKVRNGRGTYENPPWENNPNIRDFLRFD